MAKRGGRRVGGPGGILLCLGLAIVGWLIGGIEGRVVESGFRTIHTNQARLDNGRTWVDSRWELELREKLARLGELEASDSQARDEIVAEIAALSFVASVGEPEVLWPDGLRVPILFQNPVACLPVGEVFYPVSADGTILSGAWASPPKVGSGWLPVIGEVGMHYPGAAPGIVLDGEAELDAVSIATSMWVHLSHRDWGTLGRVVIDARRGRETGPDEQGARIHMELEREVWYGRPPRAGAPGSLPDEVKWTNLSKALECLRSGEASGNWAWLDLRWDRAEMRLFENEDGVDEAAQESGD